MFQVLQNAIPGVFYEVLLLLKNTLSFYFIIPYTSKNSVGIVYATLYGRGENS
jgi:hypothetical protein